MQQKLYTQVQCAELAGVPVSGLTYHMHQGHIPEPSAQIGRMRFYDEAGAAAVVEFFRQRRAAKAKAASLQAARIRDRKARDQAKWTRVLEGE